MACLRPVRSRSVAARILLAGRTGFDALVKSARSHRRIPHTLCRRRTFAAPVTGATWGGDGVNALLALISAGLVVGVLNALVVHTRRRSRGLLADVRRVADTLPVARVVLSLVVVHTGLAWPTGAGALAGGACLDALVKNADGGVGQVRAARGGSAQALPVVSRGEGVVGVVTDLPLACAGGIVSAAFIETAVRLHLFPSARSRGWAYTLPGLQPAWHRGLVQVDTVLPLVDAGLVHSKDVGVPAHDRRVDTLVEDAVRRTPLLSPHGRGIAQTVPIAGAPGGVVRVNTGLVVGRGGGALVILAARASDSALVKTAVRRRLRTLADAGCDAVASPVVLRGQSRCWVVADLTLRSAGSVVRGALVVLARASEVCDLCRLGGVRADTLPVV
eukprot:Hpha_TRINITY_DN16972_c1_g1::TRINITY_DN16972_c1_g1_i10::g.56062::m.56062